MESVTTITVVSGAGTIMDEVFLDATLLKILALRTHDGTNLIPALLTAPTHGSKDLMF